MSREAYIARAAALQVARATREGGHFFCEQLPPMDVECFLAALSEEIADVAAVSLALVGYELSDTDLRDRLNALGLAVRHVTTDRLWLAGKVEKIREVVCSVGAHVPIHGAWPARTAGATVRGRPGESRIRGTRASRSFSGRTPS